MYARIQNGYATDVRSDSPVGCFTDNLVAEFVTVPDDVQNGWLWDGTVFAAPPGPTQEQLDAIAAAQAAQAAATLAASKSRIHTAIRAERDRRKFNGVFVSGKWIHTDTYSRTQWLAMVMMGASVPTVEWATLDNSTITTSQALAAAVFNATATLDVTLFAHAKSLIAAVDAAPDPYSVDILAGWPATFGE
mgnify:CR=1 FL=1